MQPQHGEQPEQQPTKPRKSMRTLPSYFARGRMIGKGGFAKCYELTHKETGALYAVKIVSRDSIAKPRAAAKLKSEIQIHRSLKHDKIVRFMDYYEDSENVYIVLDLCPNQTLNEMLRKRKRQGSKRLTEAEAQFYVYDLLEALKYLHSQKILHRDLKLGNLFLDQDMRIKVGDFGLAAQLQHDNELRRTVCGTPNYIAPEILEGRHGHSYEVDIWSLGVIMYTMLIGKPPFETTEVKDTYKRIRMNQYEFPEDVAISPEARQLIRELLHKDPAKRPKLHEVLKSPWMQKTSIPPPVPQSIREALREVAEQNQSHGENNLKYPLKENQPPQSLSGSKQGILSKDKMTSPGLAKKTISSPHTNGAPGGPMVYGHNHGSGAPMNSGHGAHHGGSSYGMGGGGSTNNQYQIGGSHSRSATPDTRYHLDFARLDSPKGRFPLRERMESPAVEHRGQQQMPPSSSRQYNNNSRGRPETPGSVINTNVVVDNNNINNSAAKRHKPPRVDEAMRKTNNVVEDQLHSARMMPQQSQTTTASARGMNSHNMPSPSSAYGGPASARKKKESLGEPTTYHGGDHQLNTNRGATPGAGGSYGTSSPAVFLDALGGAWNGTTNNPLVSPYNTNNPSSSGTNNNMANNNIIEAHNYNNNMEPSKLPELWVTRWVDYSSKYGIGYMFSDGTIGIYFNDSTKILLDGSDFEYITRRTFEKPETKNCYSLENYPDDLRKKVTLLKHFKTYLLVQNEKKENSQAQLGVSVLPMTGGTPSRDQESRPFVKKWMKNRHAIMFQLSNKIVQVIFFDKTEIVLSSKSSMVFYVDKKGERSCYPLVNVLEFSNQELTKRLKYTKDILVNLLGGSSGPRGDVSARPKTADAAASSSRDNAQQYSSNNNTRGSSRGSFTRVEYNSHTRPMTANTGLR